MGAPTSLSVFAFDAYGTLFDVMSVTACCQRQFPAEGPELARLWRARQLQYTWLRSLMGRYADFWRVTEDALVHAAASLGLELTAGGRRELMDAYLTLEPFEDVRPGLEALKRRGVGLAVLSNGEPAMLRAVAEHADMLDLLDVLVSADEVGVFKPSPLVYRHLLQRVGKAPEEVCFVSANSWDVGGAQAAGLTTAWLQRDAAEPAEVLGLAAPRVVRTLAELESLLPA